MEPANPTRQSSPEERSSALVLVVAGLVLLAAAAAICVSLLTGSANMYHSAFLSDGRITWDLDCFAGFVWASVAATVLVICCVLCATAAVRNAGPRLLVLAFVELAFSGVLFLFLLVFYWGGWSPMALARYVKGW